MRAIACNLRTEGTDAEVFFVLCIRMRTERVNTGETSNEKDNEARANQYASASKLGAQYLRMSCSHSFGIVQ